MNSEMENDDSTESDKEEEYMHLEEAYSKEDADKLMSSIYRTSAGSKEEDDVFIYNENESHRYGHEEEGFNSVTDCYRNPKRYCRPSITIKYETRQSYSSVQTYKTRK